MDRREILESADMLKNGVILTFGDGRSAFYSASLLRSVLDEAEKFEGTAEDAEHDAIWKRKR